MTERDFDKIFKDKIGDELPFDFRPADWLAAEQELDKLLPTVAPTPRFLTWHKWAIAATVLLLGSQLFLVKELQNVKQEVASLHQENANLIANEKPKEGAAKNAESVVIQHDTIVKTVFIEVPQKSNSLENALKERGVRKADFDSFMASQNAINDKNEVGFSNNKSSKTGVSKTNLVAGNKSGIVLNADKTGLQTVENTTKRDAQKENISSNKTPLITNDFNTTEIIKDKSVLNALPNTQLIAVKSINRAKNWLNDEVFDFMPMAKRPIIKPIAEPNGWEIGANTLFLATDEHRRPQNTPARDNDRDAVLSIGANLRLGYNINRKVRVTTEVDFWSEQHGKSDIPPVSPPITPPGYTLSKVEQDTRSFQLRIGADYKLRQIFGLQPFIGIGLGYEKRVNDAWVFKFKNNNSEQRISVPNQEKFNRPISLGLRAGIEGKIYQRLGWSVNINAQGRNTLSGHFGLKYVL
jgi:hypothetical protein